MTRTGFILALCVATAACKGETKEATPEQKPPETPAPVTFTDGGAAAQQRIGTYLQDAVVTDKLRACWGKFKGDGAVAMDLRYRKSGNSWSFDDAKVTRSTLADVQNESARQCLVTAARGTSFAVDPGQALEGEAPEFIVRLGWSVPLPAKGSEISSTSMARMVGSGGGSGVITIPGCSDCVSNPNPPYGLKCATKKSGRNVDCEEISSNVCATTPTACVQGVFGGTRGVIMF